MGSLFSQTYGGEPGDFHRTHWNRAILGGVVEFPLPNAHICALLAALKLVDFPRSLNEGFGEDVHTPDLGRNPKIRAVLFYANDRCLAADPTLFAGGEFRRKNEHKFDFAPLLHAGLRIEEDSVSADVAGLRAVIGTLGCAHARRHAGGDSRSAAALRNSLHEHLTIHEFR